MVTGIGLRKVQWDFFRDSTEIYMGQDIIALCLFIRSLCLTLILENCLNM
jgi:hypothetical protein